MDLTRFFRRALQQDSWAHFYLIRGSGTIPALLDTIFCERFEACGRCRGCRLRASGNLPDLRLIVGEDSIRDEEIEELRSFIIRKPSVSRFKVVAAERAHLLTVRAQNRLLKTLEEPPEDLIFLMETEEPERLLDTVLSRAIRLRADGAAEQTPDRAGEAFLEHLDIELAKSLEGDAISKRLESFKPYRKNKDRLQSQIPLLIEYFRRELRESISGDARAAVRSLELIDLLDRVDRSLSASGNADLNIERLMLFSSKEEI